LGNEKKERPGMAANWLRPALFMVFCIGPHGNFSSIFTRFRDIAAFVLQNATFPYSTSSLPKISTCSTGSRWIAFWLQRAKVLS